jgi:hypothetical protein
MTRLRGLTAALGIAIVLGLLAPAGSALADDGSWMAQSYDPGYNQAPGKGLLSRIFNFGPTGKNIARLALTAAGTVVAGLFGSQFGMIGTIAGGAAGFLVSRWLADKILGPRDPGHGSGPPYWQQGPGHGFGRWSKILPLGGGGGELNDLRRSFHEAYDNYRRALAGGSGADKEAARSAYESARQAYFSAKSAGR